jgi:acetyltransferase-like isoleucine patch superfamily enzyme
MENPAVLGRCFYSLGRFFPGPLGHWIRVQALRMQGLAVGRCVRVGLGTNFDLPSGSQRVQGSIGDHVVIDEFCDFSAGVYLGNNISIGKNVSCIASPPHSIEIGNDCLIAKGCFIRTDDHVFQTTKSPFRQQGRKGTSISIGSNVWLGVNVVILKNTKIGANTVIGACSLVNCTIPAGVVAVGIPAKPIKSIINE